MIRFRRLKYGIFIFLLLVSTNTWMAVSVSMAEKPRVMLAKNWNPSMDVKGWWISEKLDGVRGIWTGTRMVSRSGKVLNAPVWFTENYPPFPLDGELWLGRGKFPDIVSIIRKKNPGDDWKKVRYYIFDVPREKLGFEDRLEIAKTWFEKHPSLYAEVLAQKKCKSAEHLQKELVRIDAARGEGLMLRRPGSLYRSNRSNDMVKVKTFHDTEAVVVGYTPGTGRNEGRMGALLVELPNGIRFSIGTGFTDKERDTPPPVGCTITFRYKEFNKSGIPRFASFLRAREEF